MGYAPGGVLISKKKFDKLLPSYQDALKEIGGEYYRNWLNSSRRTTCKPIRC